MKERPILFSAPMVRAILEGRKTQTRRISDRYGWASTVRRVGGPTSDGFFDFVFPSERDPLKDGIGHLVRCPYGVPGDRLWVRETWRPTATCHGEWTSVMYRADEAMLDRPFFKAKLGKSNWVPAIHMPRLACRLVLEVKRVRVERLQEISEDDAKAEGVTSPAYPVADGWVSDPKAKYSGGFGALWDSINAYRDPWSSNPWVWVVEFEKVHA